MLTTISMGLGGLGLFLLGMVLLTDGLKALAGGSLRAILTKTVRGPYSGMVAGAGITALVQSSSATTLATIGFVSAGLIGFLPAVGVVLGSNIGTTSTGWLVSVLGLKFSISAFAMPLVFAGVMIRLLVKGRGASAGLALAGFGLLFMGLSGLQESMSGLAERIDPQSLPGEGFVGRLILVGVGFAMTVVTQSSSAALATTLTALDSGAIDFERATALVIGQNMGTTLTAGIAAIGASVAAKRTALVHVLFNLMLGLLLIAILTPFLMLLMRGLDLVDVGPGVIALATFQTSCKVLGVLLVLPVLKPFAGLVERIIPERSVSPTRFLDRSVSEIGDVAAEAARRSAAETLRELVVASGAGHAVMASERAKAATTTIREFLAKLARESQTNAEVNRNLSTLHAVDHIERLAGNAEAIAKIPRIERVKEVQDRYAEMRRLALAWLDDPSQPSPAPELGRLAGEIAELRISGRRSVLAKAAKGQIAGHEVAAHTEAMIHMDRAAYHIWRAVHHLDPSTPEPMVDPDTHD
ncbi:MAG: Na/Pi cotransporter family protein [Phycisphaerales bacterium]|nr:MAG: Na/Pi cotransporter family protein [Phycisphaerales bacterium]